MAGGLEFPVKKETSYYQHTLWLYALYRLELTILGSA
jgi:hypothetical protein